MTKAWLTVLAGGLCILPLCAQDTERKTPPPGFSVTARVEKDDTVLSIKTWGLPEGSLLRIRLDRQIFETSIHEPLLKPREENRPMTRIGEVKGDLLEIRTEVKNPGIYKVMVQFRTDNQKGDVLRYIREKKLRSIKRTVKVPLGSIREQFSEMVDAAVQAEGYLRDFDNLISKVKEPGGDLKKDQEETLEFANRVRAEQRKDQLALPCTTAGLVAMANVLINTVSYTPRVPESEGGKSGKGRDLDIAARNQRLKGLIKAIDESPRTTARETLSMLTERLAIRLTQAYEGSDNTQGLEEISGILDLHAEIIERSGAYYEHYKKLVEGPYRIGDLLTRFEEILKEYEFEKAKTLAIELMRISRTIREEWK